MVRRSITAQFTLVLALVTVVVLAGFAVMIVAAHSLQNADDARTQSTDALTAANQLEQSVLDLETGLRGYLLDGKPVFLQPYQQALRRYPGLAKSLEAETAGDPRAYRNALAIHAAIRSYVTNWSEPVIRLAQRHLPAARSKEAGGGGKARVDAMRGQFATLLADETELHLQQVNQSSHLAAVVLVSGIAGVVAFALLLAYVAFRTQKRLVRPMRRLAGGVAAITAGDLSVRVPPSGTAEVAELVDGFNRMADSIERSRDELEDQRFEVEAQRDELEAALGSVEERTARIESLRRFGDRLAAMTTIEAVSEATLAGIADAGGCDVGAAYVLDSDAGCFVPVAWRGLQRGDLPLTLNPGEGLAGRAVSEGRRITVSSGETSMRTGGLGRTRAVAHEMHVPILHGDSTIGVISIGRLQQEPFSDSDLVLMSDLADRAGVDWAEAKATLQLRRTADELGAVLEATDEGVYGIDTDHRITLVNRAATEMTGYTREELLGHNAHALLHHSREDGSRYPNEECPMVLALRNGEGARVTGEVFWRRDGTSFPVEYSAYPLFHEDDITGAVVTFLDRTERRQAQRQRDTLHALTRVEAQRLSLWEVREEILAAVCEGLGFEAGVAWAPGPDENTLKLVATFAAPGYEDLLPGLGEETFTADGALAADGTLAGRAARTREPVVVTDLERDRPRPGWIADARLRSAIGNPLVSRRGDLIGVTEYFSRRPVVEEGLLEALREVSRRTTEYVERQRAEEETQKMKDQIVANVSHELRTPLTAIDGWVHVLLGEEPGPLNDEQRRFLTIVKRNSDRLMRLVGDLLVAGQVEAGKLKLERDAVDVAELARETAELVATSAQAKGIELQVHADAPVVVHGDRQRLGQLLSNLVANAIKFTPDAGAVDIRVGRRNGACCISVSDTGIGIPKGDREHLFERFYRASSATDHGIAGTGLGLAISKAIAESHDGTIELADQEGPGTTFVVELPLTTLEEVYS